MKSSFFLAAALFAGMLVLLAGSGCSSPDEAPPSHDPRFEWFAYEGNDAVYADIEADSGEYLNPILTGFHPDPSITRVGENDYYLVTSSFSYFPGLPLFHSTDLVHWTQIGHVLDEPSKLDLDSLAISEGLFAPTIRHHDGTFYVITTLVGGGGNFLVTAPSPSGPWSDPVWLPFDGIDPSIFFDDDGRVYITNNGPPPETPRYDGHRALWMQEYDPETQQMVGPREVLVNGGVDISEEPIWIEAPHIFKRNGTYYLIAAEGGTGANHSEVVFRSDAVRGPYEPYAGNPILTQRHLDPDRPRPTTASTIEPALAEGPHAEAVAALVALAQLGVAERRQHLLALGGRGRLEREPEQRGVARRREHQRLALARHGGDHLADVVDEAHVEHAIGLVEHQRLDAREVHGAPLEMIDEPARGGDEDVHAAPQRGDLRLHADAAVDGRRRAAMHVDRIDRGGFGAGGLQNQARVRPRPDLLGRGPVGLHALLHLRGELARGRDHQRADRPWPGTGALAHEALEDRQREAGRLAGAGLGGGHHVAAGERRGNRLGLDRRCGVVALFLEGTKQRGRQAEIMERHRRAPGA